MITIAGNPLVSTPDADALADAVSDLDFIVSVDIYVNETTRMADVILPAPEPLAKAHYDTALYQFAVRSVANWSPPILALPDGQPHEWEIMLRLAGIAAGQGPDADIEAWDDLVAQTLIGREVALAGSVIEGRDPAEIAAALGERRGPERLVDFMLRVGPFGEGFGADPDGLSLAKLEANPHGIDMGAMRERLPEVLRTASGKIELAPEPIVADVPRLAAELGRRINGQMVLIGRRQLRSNNSWMHNLPALVKGKDTCTVQVHPDDAEPPRARRGRSRAGHAQPRASSSSPSRSPTRSCPASSRSPRLGPRRAGNRMAVAAEHAGRELERARPGRRRRVSGNAVLNGIPVEVAAHTANSPPPSRHEIAGFATLFDAYRRDASDHPYGG